MLDIIVPQDGFATVEGMSVEALGHRITRSLDALTQELNPSQRIGVWDTSGVGVPLFAQLHTNRPHPRGLCTVGKKQNTELLAKLVDNSAGITIALSGGK